MKVKHCILFCGFIILMILSCSKVTYDNPFDTDVSLSPMQGELQITQISDSQVKLEWQLNIDIKDCYRIERKINSESYSFLTSVNANTNTFIDTALSIYNLYSYRIFGLNDQNITESISDTIQISFDEITNFEVQQQDIFTANLSWIHDCNYEEGYIIERMDIRSKEREPEESRKVNSVSKDYRDFIEIANLPANTTSYLDDTLIPDNNYEYRLKVYSNFNESNYITHSFNNLFQEPTNLTIIQHSATSLFITWVDNCEGETGFKIDKKIGNNDWQIEYVILEENINQFLDPDIQLYNTNYYRVYAYSNSIISSYVENSIYPSFPSPDNLQLEMTSLNSISLDWDDVNNFEEGYKIDKKINNNGWIIEFSILPSNSEQYIDDSIAPDNIYSYRIYAFSDTIISSVIVDSIQTSISPPSNFHEDQISLNEVRLTWNDNCSFEEGYKIDKRINNGTWQNSYAILSEDVTEFNDNSTFHIDDFYTYRLFAYAGNFESDFIECIYHPQPQLVGSVETFNAYDVCVVDNYAYITDLSRFTIVNVNDTTNPQIVSQIITPQGIGRIFIEDDYAYVSLGSDRINAIDISDPYNPSIINVFPINAGVITRDIFVDNNIAYIAGEYMDFGLFIRDISDINNPIYIVDFEVSGTANGVYVVGSNVYLASGDLQIIDVSVPYSPQVIGTCPVSGSAEKVFVEGNFAYVTSSNGISKINISNSSSPYIISSNTSIDANDVYLNSSFVFTSDYYDGLLVLNKSDLSLISYCSNSSSNGVYANNNYVFIAAGTEGLKIFQLEP